jgi:GMP synthase (glutamine-hydrolysing)
MGANWIDFIPKSPYFGANFLPLKKVKFKRIRLQHFMNLKILLLQARNNDDPVRDEERQSFAKKAGIDKEQFVPHDLLDGPPSLKEIRSHVALMVGGSGEYSVAEGNLPQFQKLLDVLAEVVEVGHPTFASCFGYQLFVKALGGEIVYDSACLEVGTYELTLTEHGRNDALLGQLPEKFYAQMGHKEQAKTQPDGVLNLASSACCQFHALRIPNKPIWATQFHPELTGMENRQRFRRYLKGYAAHMSEEEREETLSRFFESPATTDLIQSFLRHVFG